MKTKAHHAISLAIAIPVGCLAYHYVNDGLTGLCVAAGCASGVFLSPDLDLGENRKMRARNWPWVAFWFPYAKLFKHRSFWSHAPLVGTMIRLAYLFGIIGAVMRGLGYWDLFVALPWALIGWWSIGLAVSDAAHWLMD